jgi:glycosyltransferase involved in cell wall biosynthesis
MKFSIITPSFRGSKWLKLCIASVADQKGVELEHIVQDSCSDDGTQDWLPRDPRVRAFFEKDKGMYDAVNRGYRRAQGEILAYLNCDEQYLPGALQKVSDYFQSNPDVDVAFGDCVVVDGHGNYLCERRVLVPQSLYVQVAGSLSFFTAATFLRRHVLDRHQVWFNPNLRDIGDAEWALRLLQSNLRMAVLPEFISVFTETGNNMNLGANAAREKKEFIAAAPLWVRMLRPFIVVHFRLRRWQAGYYQCKPQDYAIYTLDSPDRRKAFHVTQPTFRWIRWQKS